MSFDYREFLSGKASDEMISTLSTLGETLVSVGPTLFEDELELLRSNESYEDDMAIAVSVEQILRIAADVVFSHAGVTFDGTMPVRLVEPAIVAMIEIPDDLIETIQDMMAEERQADDILADYLGLVTVYPAEDWIEWIISVDESFTIRLADTLVAMKQSQVLKLTPEQVEQIRSNPMVSAFKTAYPDSILNDAVDNGVTYGTTMESLMPFYEDRIVLDAQGNPRPVEDVTRDVVSLCSLSCTTLEELHDESQFFLDGLFHDVNSSQKASSCLKAIVGNVKGHYPS